MSYKNQLLEHGYSEESLSEYDVNEKSIDNRIAEIVEEDATYAKTRQRQLSPKRQEAYKYYRGESMGNEREGRSKFVSRDMMTTIEWKMPSLMKYFCQGDQIVTVSPIGPDDDERAEKTEALLNYDFFIGNKGFIKLYKIVKKAEELGTAYVKTGWEERYIERPMEYAKLTQDQFDELVDDENVEMISYEEQQIGVMPGLPDEDEDKIPVFTDDVENPEELSPEPLNVYKNVKVKRTIWTYRGPTMKIVPNENLLIDPECLDITEANYVIETYYPTLGDLYDDQDDGLYKNVDLLKATLENTENSEIQAEKSAKYAEVDLSNPMHEVSESSQISRKIVEVMEYWGNVDILGNGRAIPWKAVVANGVTLLSEPNPYNFNTHPYDALRPNIDPDQQEGIGCYDTVGPFQEAKTSIVRQMLDNISFQNNQMWEVDRNAGVDYKSLLNPRPGGVVRVDRLGGVRPLTPPPLQGYTMQAMEFLQSLLEALTGQTRYSQGMDAGDLNKTATGITQIMQRSDQRNWLEAKLMAEDGLFNMFSKWQSLNSQYMPEEFIFRIYETDYNINPDDVAGHFDIKINIGESLAEVQQAVNQMMRLIQMAPQLMEGRAMTPDDFYYMYRDLLKKWGYRDFEKYSTNPKFTQTLVEQSQRMQATLQAIMDAGLVTPEQIQQAVMAQQQKEQQGGQNGGQPEQGTGTGTGRERTANTGGVQTASV